MTRLFRKPILAPARIRVERARVADYNCDFDWMPKGEASASHQGGSDGLIITLGHGGKPIRVCPLHARNLAYHDIEKRRTCTGCLRVAPAFLIDSWRGRHPHHHVCAECYGVLVGAVQQLNKEGADAIEIEKNHEALP